jgi:5-formyltetrahydrofolate cyclo-ligase
MKKAEIRELYKAKREGLSENELREKSSALTEMVFDSVDFSLATYVHIFLPIVRHREIDTTGLIARLNREFPNIRVCVPRMIEGQNRFESVVLLEGDVLELNRFGVPEPVGSFTVDPSLIDIVFAPLLCADSRGFRVGYGKGFYDDFLGQTRSDCMKIGLSMFPVIDEIEDVGSHDIALDSVIVA